MTDRELMQQALDALEEVQMAIYTTPWLNRRVEAIRARLAQPEPEPVAWRYGAMLYQDKLDALEFMRTSGDGYKLEPLYTAPPRKEWQGLTDEEIDEAHETTISFHGFARAIEQALKEKNYG